MPQPSARVPLAKANHVGADERRYDDFYAALLAIMPRHRLVRDPLRRLAYGTDASFYRLVPQLVVIVESETEVQALLHICVAASVFQ